MVYTRYVEPLARLEHIDGRLGHLGGYFLRFGVILEAFWISFFLGGGAFSVLITVFLIFVSYIIKQVEYRFIYGYGR